jgi:hypothetical protein
MKNYLPRQAGLSAVALVAAITFAELSDFSVSSYGVTAGSRTSAVATLTAMTKSPIPVVTFTSSNPSAVQVPLSKIASANGTVVIDVTAVAPGCAVVRASYGGHSRSDDVVVHPPATTSAFTMKVPDQVLPFPGLSEGTLTKSVSLSGSSDPGSGGTLTINRSVWSLSSSNTSVVTVPDSVTQVSTNTTFKIVGKGEGCATITARLGTLSVKKTVMTRYIGG